MYTKILSIYVFALSLTQPICFKLSFMCWFYFCIFMHSSRFVNKFIINIVFFFFFHWNPIAYNIGFTIVIADCPLNFACAACCSYHPIHAHTKTIHRTSHSCLIKSILHAQKIPFLITISKNTHPIWIK